MIGTYAVLKGQANKPAYRGSILAQTSGGQIRGSSAEVTIPCGNRGPRKE
jgi:hypothetical protein